MFCTLRALALGFAVCLPASALSRAAAQSGPTPQAEAAAHFDLGIEAYKQADYPRAAEAFLAADAALASATALSNALSAARRAQLPLLIARAAERMAARPDTSAADREAAAQALREVAPRLAQLEVSCQAAGCAARIDGAPLAQRGSYVLPGEHRVEAEGYQAATPSCAEGQRCRVELSPLPQVPVSPAQVSAAQAAAESSGPRAAPAPDEPPRAQGAPRWKRRLPLGVFVASSAGALALAALATWSGVEALHAKRDYDPASDDWDDVRKLARRSDLFIAGSLVLAGSAIATAIWWVEWDALGRSQLTLLPEGGATLVARRRF